MTENWWKEQHERTQKAQQEAVDHHKAQLRCAKCKCSGSCHAYIPNCGAFQPR